MKRLGKRILKIVALALAIALATALFPYARDLLNAWLPQGKYRRAAVLISHEMEKAGELTAVRYIDREMMEATTNALLVGTVQRVKAPYTYEIGLGISLSQVEVKGTEGGITISVPPVEVLYDSFQVTGDPQIEDFWHLLTQNRYQEMLNAQAAACREKYVQDETCMQAAWKAACEALEKLIVQWTGEEVPLRFEQKEEKTAA